MLVSTRCLSFEQLEHPEEVAADFCSLMPMDHDPLLSQETNVQKSKERDMLLTWIVDRIRTWHWVLVEEEAVDLLLKLSLLYSQYYSALS